MSASPEGIFVHYSRARADWETPPELFAEYDREFQFTLDACATELNAKCRRFFTPEIDGLAQSWGDERVWCNPPYGAAVAKWIRKAYDEVQRATVLAVLLVPSRTDTDWWHDYAMKGEVRFIRRRVPFVRSDGQRSRAPFPSALVIFRRTTSP
jgi:phage N-6-adenine-methyltransferase